MNKVLKQQIEKAFKAALLDKVLQIGDNQTVYNDIIIGDTPIKCEPYIRLNLIF